MSNQLYYGDNLEILERHVKPESVDLVYLDPPFQSGRNYNILYSEPDGRRSVAQAKAFEDTWTWDASAAKSFELGIAIGGPVADTLVGLRKCMGECDMLAYVSMLAPRLVALHRTLSPTGSLFLHCDPTASHYIKILLDATFGPAGFRNEIIWCYRGGGVPKNCFARKHDTIFFYAKSKRSKFNPLYVPYSEASSKLVESRGGVSIDGLERPLDRGAHMPDWWTDINSLQTWSPERLGYPTQKPKALLERIISASTDENDTVLDPFCGCGTAIDAAISLKRRWIGIDVTHLAVALIRKRLRDVHGKGIDKSYKVIGEPTTADEAVALAEADKYQFQFWALGLVDARPADERKGADGGIDGRLYFHDDAGGRDTKSVVISVKGGKIGPSQLRDLRGVVERENAAIGVFISLEEPTKAMRSEAASAGFYKSPWGTSHSRLQLLTISDLMAGSSIDMPRTDDQRTFKKAAARVAELDQGDLYDPKRPKKK